MERYSRVLTIVALAVGLAGGLRTSGWGQVQEQPATSSRGELSLRERISDGSSGTSGEVSVGLDGYTGAPITALQFVVTASGSVTIEDVRAEGPVADSTRWKVFTNRVSADTVRVVMFSPVGEGLTGAARSSLVLVTYRRTDPRVRGGIHLHNVVGGLPTGANAGLGISGPITLQPRATE